MFVAVLHWQYVERGRQDDVFVTQRWVLYRTVWSLNEDVRLTSSSPTISTVPQCLYVDRRRQDYVFLTQQYHYNVGRNLFHICSLEKSFICYSSLSYEIVFDRVSTSKWSDVRYFGSGYLEKNLEDVAFKTRHLFRDNYSLILTHSLSRYLI